MDQKNIYISPRQRKYTPPGSEYQYTCIGKGYVNGKKDFNKDAWVKTVAVIKNEKIPNFWEGNYNCFIVIKDVNICSDLTISFLKNCLEKVDMSITKNLPIYLGIKKPSLQNSRDGKYANLNFEIYNQLHPNNKQTGLYELLRLNIHVINPDGKNHQDSTELDSLSEEVFIKTFNEKLNTFCNSILNKTAENELNLITEVYCHQNKDGEIRYKFKADNTNIYQPSEKEVIHFLGNEVNRLEYRLYNQEENFNKVKTFFQNSATEKEIENGKIALEFNKEEFATFKQENCLTQ